MGEIISKLFIATILLAIIPMVSASCDSTDGPNYGTVIIVDGDEIEWMDTDFFAKMFEAGKENHPHLANLSLQYNCTEGKLYALVWTVNGKIDTTKGPAEHYIKIGQNDVYVNSGDPNTEFQFINNDGERADSWEARIDLPEGCYSNDSVNGLNVHTQVYYDGESQTARPSHNPFDIDLYICCRDIPIPEFPTMALPIAAILGLMFILQSRRRKED